MDFLGNRLKPVWSSYGQLSTTSFDLCDLLQTSSIRRVGDYYDAAADSLSLYEGTYFSGKQVFTESYLSTIGTGE